MDKLITEDILKQIRLINYERSKTLLEQSVIGAPNYGTTTGKSDAEIKADIEKRKIEKKIDQNCKSLLNSPLTKESEKTAKKIFLILKTQIDTKGTKEEIILDALKLIKSKETYVALLVFIYGCYPQEQGKTILQFIQGQEFSLGSWGSEWKRNTPTGLGQEIQWEFNDYWLEEYQKILQKFNPNETYDFEVPEFESDTIKSISKEVLPPFTREVAHIVLPILSIATSFIGVGVGIGAWLLKSGLSFGIESLDAAIYKYADEDDYAAGLALIFAFAGPLDSGLEMLVTKYGSSLIKKIALKEVTFSKGELELAADVVANGGKYIRLSKLGMARQFTKQILTKASNSSDVLNFILKLMKKGYLTANFTGRLGLMIGGSFYTWDAIAKNMGICNPAPLKMLTQSDWKILKAVGEAGKYIQPFTNSCEVESVIKKLESVRTDNSLFIQQLQKAKNENETFSTKYGYYNTDVLIIQFILIAAKLDSKLNVPNYNIKNNLLTINNSEDIDNLSMYSATGTLIKTINNKNKLKTLTYNFGNLKSIVIMRVTMFDQTTHTVKLFVGKDVTKSGIFSFGKIGSVKYGTFDKATEDLVKIYQKQNGLKVDGVVGSDTLAQLISDLKSKKYGTIKNITGENFDEIRISEVKETYDAYMKQKDKLLLDQKMVEEAQELDKNNRSKLVKDVTNGLKDTDKMSEEEFNQIFGKYKMMD